MESDKIIVKVTEHTDWVNSIVVVEKPKTGQLRCIDPKALNDTICRPNYPMPALEVVTANLTGASHFSILDIILECRVRETIVNVYNFLDPIWQISLFKAAIWNIFIW
jgi:hypothetical protein